MSREVEGRNLTNVQNAVKSLLAEIMVQFVQNAWNVLTKFCSYGLLSIVLYRQLCFNPLVLQL